MTPDNALLAAALGAVAALLLTVVLLQRGDRSLRARLVLIFVALAITPATLTGVVLWREMGPRTRLQATEGIGRTLQSALTVARLHLAERQTFAEQRAAAHCSRDSATASTSDSAPESRAVLRYSASNRQLHQARGTWSAADAERFLDRLAWPVHSPPPQIYVAADSGHVVVGVATCADSTQTVLVALSLSKTEADAITAVVHDLRQSQRLGYLEELKLSTATRVLAGLTIVFVLAAVLLGIAIARTLTRPVEELRAAFDAVANGDFGTEVASRPEGELGQLVLGFNRMSRELLSSKRELERAARLAAWQGVARRLAHEIKNPLTPITLSIHRLRRRTPAQDDVVRECLDTILEETRHLERLANEFSSFARMPKPRIDRLDLRAVVEQVLELHAAHPGIRIDARLDGMPHALADRDQVRQMCTNLVKNAIESMSAGGVLEVLAESDSGQVILQFRDTGAGFSPEALTHLFDPTFTTKPGGSGLGLAIVRRIVEDHGGRIEVGNRDEGGAWIRVSLPAAP